MISYKKDSYILVIDSGNGGKFTLKKLKKLLPNENFLFLQDDKNAPYGAKTKHRLQKIFINLVEYATQKFDIKMIVVACNTLSSCITNDILEKFLLPILLVTPCVKNFTTNTLILCTSATKKYNQDLKKLRNNKNINIKSFKFLAKKIDKNIQNLSTLQSYFNKSLKKYANMNISAVVLGCTHYNLVKTQIERALTNNPLVKTNSNSYVGKNNGLKTSKIQFLENSEFCALKAKNALKALSLQNGHKNGKTIVIKTSQTKI